MIANVGSLFLLKASLHSAPQLKTQPAMSSNPAATPQLPHPPALPHNVPHASSDCLAQFLSTMNALVDVFRKTSDTMTAQAREGAIAGMVTCMKAASLSLTGGGCGSVSSVGFSLPALQPPAEPAPEPALALCGAAPVAAPVASPVVSLASTPSKRLSPEQVLEKAAAVLKKQRRASGVLAAMTNEYKDSGSSLACKRVRCEAFAPPVVAAARSWLHEQGAVEALVAAASSMAGRGLGEAVVAALASEGRHVGAVVGSVVDTDIEALARSLPAPVSLVVLCRKQSGTVAHMPTRCQVLQYRDLEGTLVELDEAAACWKPTARWADMCTAGVVLLLMDAASQHIFKTNRMPLRALLATQAEGSCLTLAHMECLPTQEREAGQVLHMLLAPRVATRGALSASKGKRTGPGPLFTAVCGAAGVDVDAAFEATPSFYGLLRGVVGAALGFSAPPDPPSRRPRILNDDDDDDSVSEGGSDSEECDLAAGEATRTLAQAGSVSGTQTALDDEDHDMDLYV